MSGLHFLKRKDDDTGMRKVFTAKEKHPDK
nr:MAG TPA: hypothetical protein [Caudoviricetes sp.]